MKLTELLDIWSRHRRSSRFVPTPMAGPSVTSAGSRSRGTAGCLLTALVLLVTPAPALACEIKEEVHDIWQDESVMNADISFQVASFGEETYILATGKIFFHYEKEGNNRLLKVAIPLDRSGVELKNYGGIWHNSHGSSIDFEEEYTVRSYRSIYSVIPRGCDDVICTLRKVSVVLECM